MTKRPVATYYTSTCYQLTKGLPYGKKWDNNDRVRWASAVAAERISVVDAAKAVGCVPNTIRNWVKTLDFNNPKL